MRKVAICITKKRKKKCRAPMKTFKIPQYLSGDTKFAISWAVVLNSWVTRSPVLVRLA